MRAVERWYDWRYKGFVMGSGPWNEATDPVVEEGAFFYFLVWDRIRGAFARLRCRDFLFVGRRGPVARGEGGEEGLRWGIWGVFGGSGGLGG